MARYFFHQHTPDGFLADPDGSELPDVEAARAEAIASARQLWASAILSGTDLPERRFQIDDQAGCNLLSVSFCEALPPSLRRAREPDSTALNR